MSFSIRQRLTHGPVTSRTMILFRIMLLFLCFSLSSINACLVQTDYVFFHVFPPGLNGSLFLFTLRPLQFIIFYMFHIYFFSLSHCLSLRRRRRRRRKKWWRRRRRSRRWGNRGRLIIISMSIITMHRYI